MADRTLSRTDRARMVVACADALDRMQPLKVVATLKAFGVTAAAVKPPGGFPFDYHMHECLNDADDSTIAELHAHLCEPAGDADTVSAPPEHLRLPTFPDRVLLRTQQNTLLSDIERLGFSRTDFEWISFAERDSVAFALEFIPVRGFLFQIDSFSGRGGETTYVLRLTPGVQDPTEVVDVQGFDVVRRILSVWLDNVSREDVPNLWRQPPDASDWLQQDASEQPLSAQQQRQIADGLDEMRVLIEQQGQATTAMLNAVRHDVEAIKSGLPQATVRSATHAVGVAILKWMFEGIADALLLPRLIGAARLMLQVAGLLDFGKLPLPPGAEG